MLQFIKYAMTSAVNMSPTLWFMLLDGAAIFRETTEFRFIHCIQNSSIKRVICDAINICEMLLNGYIMWYSKHVISHDINLLPPLAPGCPHQGTKLVI